MLAACQRRALGSVRLFHLICLGCVGHVCSPGSPPPPLNDTAFPSPFPIPSPLLPSPPSPSVPSPPFSLSLLNCDVFIAPHVSFACLASPLKPKCSILFVRCWLSAIPGIRGQRLRGFPELYKCELYAHVRVCVVPVEFVSFVWPFLRPDYPTLGHLFLGGPGAAPPALRSALHAPPSPKHERMHLS